MDLSQIKVPCSVCGIPFADSDWEDRHEEDNGEVYHADCCPVCIMEDAADLEDALDALLA